MIKYLTFLIFAVSFLGSLHFYTLIGQSKQKNYFLKDKFQAGEKSFDILSGNLKIGNFIEKFNNDKGFYEYGNDGFINIKSLGQNRRIDFSASLIFNEIDQLGASILRIKLNDQDMILGSTEIDPIKVKLKLPFKIPVHLMPMIKAFSQKETAASPVKINEHENGTNFEFLIPGPVNLVETSDKSSVAKKYSLYWDYFSNIPFTDNYRQSDSPATILTQLPAFSMLDNLSKKLRELDIKALQSNPAEPLEASQSIDIDQLLYYQP